MLTCTRCCLIFSGWPASKVCSVCNGELRALLREDQRATFNAPLDVAHCLVCQSTLEHRPRNTRYCSSTCSSRAKYWYKLDPDKYHMFAPQVKRPDLAAKHAARRAQKEAGYLDVPRPNALHNTQLVNLNDPTEVMWLLAAFDEPAIKEAGSVTYVTTLLSGPADGLPAAYAAWRAQQPWAAPHELSTKLDSLLSDPPTRVAESQSIPSPVQPDSAPGVDCICSLCDARFKAPFDTDICPSCL